MNYDDVLAVEVQGAFRPVYRTSKPQVMAGYQDKYGDRWSGELAVVLAGTTDKKSKEYRAAIRQLQLRKGKITAPSKVNQPRYEKAGRTLPPMGFAPPSSFTVTFKLDIRISEKCGNIRGPYTVHIGGDDAKEFAKNPSWEMVLAYYEGGGENADYDNSFGDVCAVIMLRVK